MISPAHCAVVIYHKWNENEHIFMVGEKKKKKFLTDVKGEKECFTLSGLAAWS
jgi:hypothetical protein